MIAYGKYLQRSVQLLSMLSAKIHCFIFPVDEILIIDTCFMHFWADVC